MESFPSSCMDAKHPGLAARHQWPIRPAVNAARPFQPTDLLTDTTGLTPNSLLFHDEDRMSLLPSTPLPTLHSSLIAFEDNLMRHLILSRDADNQGKGGIGRSQFVRLYNRYRADPNSLADDQKAVVFAVLCLAKHDTLHQYYSTGRWSEVRVQVEGGQIGRDDGDGDTEGEEQGPLRGHGVIGDGDGDRSANGKARGPVGREDVTYFRMACGCLAGVRNPSVYAVCES